MRVDGDWQAVEGVLTKDMETVSEYLQTWKLKLSATKTVSSAFHRNNKEASRELKVKFCYEPKYLGVTLDRSSTYGPHLESLRKKLTSRVALLRRLAGSFWCAGATANSANSQHSRGAIDRRGMRAFLVPQCSYPPHQPRRLANCDWMPASYTSGQPSNPRRHPTF